MIVRCPGWGTPRHAPLVMGEKEPFNDKSITDGMCPECEAAFTAQGDAMVAVQVKKIGKYTITKDENGLCSLLDDNAREVACGTLEAMEYAAEVLGDALVEEWPVTQEGA